MLITRHLVTNIELIMLFVTFVHATHIEPYKKLKENAELCRTAYWQNSDENYVVHFQNFLMLYNFNVHNS